MSIIQMHDRKKFGVPVTRIIFTKSVDNFILPKDYTSFDICCVGGGSSGSPGGTYGIRYQQQPVGVALKNFMSMSGPGGWGGMVITKKNIELPKSTKISVKIGNGGHIDFSKMSVDQYGVYCGRKYDIKANDKCSGGTIYGGNYARRTSDGKPEYYMGKGITDVYRGVQCSYYNEGSGENSFVKNLDNNIILCNAEGGQIHCGNDVNDGSQTNGYLINLLYEIWKSLGHDQNGLARLLGWLLSGGGANPGGHIYAGRLKGFTEGDKNFNILDNTYYSEGYLHTNYYYMDKRRDPSIGLNEPVDDGYTKYGINYFHLVRTTSEPVSFSFLKPDGQNIFGLGVSHIMNDPLDDPISTGGCSSAMEGEPYYMTNGTIWDVNKFDPQTERKYGGGSSPKIKYLKNENDSYKRFKCFEVLEQATNGKPNTGSGGGGGAAFTQSINVYGAGGFYGFAKPGDGGSGVVYIDCFPSDFRPSQKVIGRKIIV